MWLRKLQKIKEKIYPGKRKKKRTPARDESRTSRIHHFLVATITLPLGLIDLNGVFIFLLSLWDHLRNLRQQLSRVLAYTLVFPVQCFIQLR
jgi:hypothetical protein